MIIIDKSEIGEIGELVEIAIAIETSNINNIRVIKMCVWERDKDRTTEYNAATWTFVLHMFRCAVFFWSVVRAHPQFSNIIHIISIYIIPLKSESLIIFNFFLSGR